MVATPRKSQLKKALKKGLFIQTCGLLIPGLGSGTRFVNLLSLPYSMQSLHATLMHMGI